MNGQERAFPVATEDTQTDRLRGVSGTLEGLNERLGALTDRLGLESGSVESGSAQKTPDAPPSLQRDSMVGVITEMQRQCERLHEKAHLLDTLG